jgi:nucleoside-diphosphate-sugar epimerase
VTGATGFVGGHLCGLLHSSGHEVIGTKRSSADSAGMVDYDLRSTGDVGGNVDWGPILEGVDYVVHLAARVHVMKDVEKDPLAAFRKVNVKGTETLLRHEGMRDVKRVIYVSTVKVYGDETREGPFSSADDMSPSDPYATSKLEAEHLVEEIGACAGFETTIIRPPLVYGPGVGGNFVRLLGMVDKGIPLPLGLIKNSRSLVSVDNLCDLIRECLTNQSASGKQFLVSDNSDVSTPDLIRLIASTMSRPARLIPVPPAILRLAAKLVGRSAEASRLIGSLQVDIDEAMRVLNWKPPVSLADGIRSTVTWYEEQKANG